MLEVNKSPVDGFVLFEIVVSGVDVASPESAIAIDAVPMIDTITSAAKAYSGKFFGPTRVMDIISPSF